MILCCWTALSPKLRGGAGDWTVWEVSGLREPSKEPEKVNTLQCVSTLILRFVSSGAPSCLEVFAPELAAVVLQILVPGLVVVLPNVLQILVPGLFVVESPLVQDLFPDAWAAAQDHAGDRGVQQSLGGARGYSYIS